MNVSVDLQVACRVDSVPLEIEVRSWLEQAYLAGGRDTPRQCDVAVRIVDEDESRKLNNRFRRQDKATNVLAFPAEIGGLPADEVRPLGDLVICGPLVEREAQDQGKSPAGHWGHLLVHGMLHLLGYDHQTTSQAAEMETMERRILADCGFEDPYRER
ncbi:MAG: rRNA maturation RNase YbeY [Woeseiaceae bacterium]